MRNRCKALSVKLRRAVHSRGDVLVMADPELRLVSGGVGTLSRRGGLYFRFVFRGDVGAARRAVVLRKL